MEETVRNDGQPRAESGGNKGQLSNLAEVLCRDFRLHDDNFKELAFVLGVLYDLIEAFECLVEM